MAEQPIITPEQAKAEEILKKDRQDRQNRAAEEIQAILDRENCAIVCSLTFDELRGGMPVFNKKIVAL